LTLRPNLVRLLTSISGCAHSLPQAYFAWLAANFAMRWLWLTGLWASKGADAELLNLGLLVAELLRSTRLSILTPRDVGRHTRGRQS